MSPNAASPEGTVSRWWQQNEVGKKAIGSFRAGLAAVISVWLANLLVLPHSYWAAVSAIVVMGWDSTLTFASCRDRVLGTAVGAFLGWVTFYAWHGHYLLYGVSVALCVFVCSAFQFDKAGRLAAATLSIIVLVPLDAPPSKVALGRFLEVGIGVTVAYIVSLVVFPSPTAKTDAKAAV
jgi:uncharacterized membrane protein YgaE (UPF0421/DUF939 family)